MTSREGCIPNLHTRGSALGLRDKEGGNTAMSKRQSDRQSTGAPTLIDVAKVAGVSPITVSRALGRPELVTDANRIVHFRRPRGSCDDAVTMAQSRSSVHHQETP